MKKLIALALIFLALGAFVYFYELAGEEEREKAKKLEESLFRIEEESIESLEISREEDSQVRLRKDEDKWMLVAPL